MNSLPPAFKRKAGGFAAFTLIELLAALAVVAILATILIPLISSSRTAAFKAQTVSDLRSVGSAIISYVSERPDMRLPGGSPFGITPVYSRNSVRDHITHLPAAIAPYLGYPGYDELNASERKVIRELQNRAVGEFFPNLSGNTHYVQNYTLERYSSGRSNPFVFGADYSSALPPMSVSEADAFGGPSRVWILTELDASIVSDNPKMAGVAPAILSGAGWYNSQTIPATPVWGNGRLRLYLDGHVSFVPRDEDP